MIILIVIPVICPEFIEGRRESIQYSIYSSMCRNIKPLFNFEPPAPEEEIQNAALQFVRKVSGFQKPSYANVDAFEKAVLEITKTTQTLFTDLETTSDPKSREEEERKRKERSKKRFPKKY